MTLNEIRNSDKPVLTCAEIAPALQADPAALRWQAHNEPEKLGFPVIVVKTRVKIPRIPFIKFIEEGEYGNPAAQET